MKKGLVTAASLLLCFLAHSQEADELGSAAELSVVARGEYLNTDPLGNSSLYTLLEGSLTENLSYSISNHWLSSDPGTLYRNTLRSDDVNWLDWAYLTYSFNDFSLSAGKNVLLWGTFEYDEYDFDIHYPFSSSVWNNMNSYQWGVSAAWTPAEDAALEFMASTSPFGEKPFASKLFAYGARFSFGGEPFSAKIAYNHIGTGLDGNEAYMGVVSGGVRVSCGGLQITGDFSTRTGDEEDILAKGLSSALDVKYTFSDRFDMALHGNNEWNGARNTSYCSLGAVAQYYPVENLRIHLLGAGYWGHNIDQNGIAPVFSVGLTYTFSAKW